ncbi:Chitin synthase regulatory factor 3 [Fusarium albosuccineum]|uniref:Chitin synthase regulatory factor 3 n=2 Tax=Fusarium decemcellulare species complex TaxID=1329916 RepID=A0A8H4LBR8_9HYPO|nr:Chitin synthase regulatory factor 3 [Fusarium albosuccineum]
MAYDGGYGGQQRPYGGPAPPRAAPRQHAGAPPQQYGAQQQNMEASIKTNIMGEGRLRLETLMAQGQGVEGQFPVHRRLIRTAVANILEGGWAQGQVEECPMDRLEEAVSPQFAPLHASLLTAIKARRGPTNTPPMSPRDGHFNHQYPPQGGRRPDVGHEQQMVDQMSNMDLNQRPRPSLDSQRGQGDYRRQPMNGGRGPPARGYQQGFPDSRGPPPRQDQGYGAQGGYGGYDDGYSGAPEPGFGPPARSMTMPVEDSGSRNNMQSPQRVDPGQYSTPAGRGIPQRPSTAGGHRAPPPRSYTADPHGAPAGQYGGGYDDGRGYRQQSTGSYDDVYDSYFDNQRNSGGPQPQQNRGSYPDFDAAPAPGNRGSFEQSMRPGPEQPQRGAHQTAVLNHAKSQPMLRQPQAAVFEMAGDVPDLPPVPPVPQMNNHQASYDQGYNGSGGYEQMPPRGPSAPPAAMNGARGGGPVNPDGLPSHPAPVRPGLMQDSMVSMSNKPAPVRNYGVSTPAPPPQPQPQQQRQPQYQQPPQQQSPPRSSGSREPARDDGPVTTQELEHLRMLVKSNSSDQDSALKLARRLVEAADVLAPKMPDPKQRTRARERYLIDCHKILKKLSNAQNPDAMFFLADCLGRSLFGEADHKEAFTQYQSAAKLGHPAAAYRTAVCCEIGHEDGGGTRRDPMKAIQWYKRAATLGDPPAMYKVGMILLKGLLGQPKNPREAVGWLKRAAERADAENPHALHELGLLYESAQPNDFIIRDEPYAYSLFLQAANLGYKFSQYRLGCAFEYGLLGCPIDPRQSIMWYSKAATKEEHQAELALSGWYLTGSEGVMGQSDTEAYLWARKAAIAGLAKAEYAMGYFTEVGIGVPPNLEDAKRWYWRAAAQDFPKARERLEDLKRAGKNGVRQRERISRSKIEKHQEGDCTVM